MPSRRTPAETAELADATEEIEEAELRGVTTEREDLVARLQAGATVLYVDLPDLTEETAVEFAAEDPPLSVVFDAVRGLWAISLAT